MYLTQGIDLRSFFLIFICTPPAFRIFSSSHPTLTTGDTRELKCPLITSADCKISSVQEQSKISCDDLKANAVDVDPKLYGGLPSFNLNLMAHPYYYAKVNYVFGSCCPTNSDEINVMELGTLWTGAPTSQAWEVGYRARAFRRNCTFPAAKAPFTCYGVDGTQGVHGKRLGTIYNFLLLTNDAREGKANWILFGQCWDANGSKTPVSWNVFSLLKNMSVTDKNAIKTKLQKIGFQTSKQWFIEMSFP